MNYSELKTAVADWAHRSNVPAPNIDLFIDLAESFFNTHLRCVEQETVANLICSSRFTDLPADFLAMRAVEYSGTHLTPIPYEAPEYMAIRSSMQVVGSPRAYCIRGAQIELMPAPTDDTLLGLTYFAKVPALSDADPTNWLLESQPMLYLYECLRQMAIWTHDDAGVAKYAAIVQGVLDGIQRADKQKRYSGPMRVRAA